MWNVLRKIIAHHNRDVNPKNFQHSSSFLGIENVCHGTPHMSSYGLIVQCHDACPRGFWCNNIGIPGQGGICCPLSISGLTRQLSSVQIHPGKCPQTLASLDTIGTGAPVCKLKCHSDADCRQKHKCCFDGCGTNCMEVSGSEN